MATCPTCHGPMLTEWPHAHQGVATGANADAPKVWGLATKPTEQNDPRLGEGCGFATIPVRTCQVCGKQGVMRNVQAMSKTVVLCTIDQAEGPDKVWRCSMCGGLFRFMRGADGIDRLVEA